MIDFIVSEFKKISEKAIRRYAAKYGVKPQQVQVRFRIENDALTYSICDGYQKRDGVTFLQILDVKLDLRGYSMIAPPFIKKAIESIAKQRGDDPSQVYVFVTLNANDDIVIWLFDKTGTAVKKIEMEDLFSEVPNE